MTPQEFVRHLERTADALAEELVAAEALSLRELQAEAVALSQGPLQPADLVRLGHPYSRRRGARLNPNIINRVSGDFAGAWETEGPEWDGDDLVSTLHNTDPKAPDLEAGIVKGQPLMVPRRPNEEAGERVQPRREARALRVLERLTR